MNLHQVLTGAVNPGDNCFSVGNVDGHPFTVSLCLTAGAGNGFLLRPLLGSWQGLASACGEPVRRQLASGWRWRRWKGGAAGAFLMGARPVRAVAAPMLVLKTGGGMNPRPFCARK